MKNFIAICIVSLALFATQSCRTAKQINKVVAPKDTTAVAVVNTSAEDSIKLVNTTMDKLHSHYIDFKTFNAKIKVEYEDSKGKKPDLNAVVRIVKDSAIWVSITASFLNFEVSRMLITKDSVILMDMREKEVQYRSLDYLQEVTEIPFTYTEIQDLFIGNPIFLDSNIVSFKKTDGSVLISTAGKFFKHLLTLSTDNSLLLHSKLDDVDVSRNRTADITYGDFENKDGKDFSTYREVMVSEKNKVDIRLNYKQYEFNKELTITFRVPKNFKRK